METRQHVHFEREPRKQPAIPVLAAVGVPVRPGDAGAELIGADRLQVGEQPLDAFFFTGPKPFQNAEKRAARSVPHTARPRAASSREAPATLSTAVCPSSHSASSVRPSSSETDGA